jgi:hypothetical protein
VQRNPLSSSDRLIDSASITYLEYI